MTIIHIDIINDNNTYNDTGFLTHTRLTNQECAKEEAEGFKFEETLRYVSICGGWVGGGGMADHESELSQHILRF